MYDVFGLPLHPLVVHAAVVLLPLGALGVILSVVFAGLRRRYVGLSVLGLAAGTGAAFVAVQSGLALAEQVGTPAAHMAAGQLLQWVAAGGLVVTVAWYFLQRGKDEQPIAARITGIAAALVSAAVIALTVVVGHSGATAVWSGTGASPSAATTGTPSATATATASATESGTASGSPSASASASPSSTAEQSYTLDQVKEHNTAADCWAAINGGVYNLTDWVNQHPGGSDRIIPLCGTDASAAFNAQHGGQSKPESQLTQFYIGELKS